MLFKNKLTETNYSYLSLLVLISLFITVFIMGLLKIYSPDLGFHLKSAQWILENKQFIYRDSFSYASDGNKYFDLQWLYQIFIYLIYNYSEKLLVIVNALLITFSIILIYYRFIKFNHFKNNHGAIALFVLIAILMIQPLSFEIRPHVLSWIFLNFIIIILETYKREKKNILIALPVVMLVWVNSHSLSILGLITIIIYNIGIYLEQKKLDKKLLLFSGFSLVAFLINPYFIEGLLYPFTQFGIISGNGLLKSYIGEFQSPFTANEIKMLGSKYFVNPLFILHLSAITTIICIVRALKLKQYTDVFMLAAFVVLLFLAHKNYGYYLVVSLPLIVKYIYKWLIIRQKNIVHKPINTKTKNSAEENKKNNDYILLSSKIYKRISFTAILLGIFISITSLTDGYAIFRGTPFRFGITRDKDQLPVEATEFLNNNKITGKVLNHLDYGGYLMANYKEKVYIDGRLEPIKKEVFNAYYESLTKRNGIQNILKEYKPDVVIFPYVKATYWWDYFVAKKEKSGYKAVYFDGLSVIYLKANTYPQLPEINENTILQTLNKNKLNQMNASIETSKAKGLMVLLKGLFQKQSFSIADQNKATYCFSNGFDSCGLIYSVECIENSTVHTPNIYKNLSIFFNGKKMYNQAQLCEEKSE